MIDAQLLASASVRVLAKAQMTFCAAIPPWLLLTAALGACAHTGAGWRDGPADREMKNVIVQPVHATSDQSIAWVDEERVLFEGWDKHLVDPVEKNSGRPVPMHGLYIWNVRSGAVVRYTKEPLRSRMCFSEGFISYSVRRSGRTVRLEGPFGEEREVAMYAGEEQLNPFTCRWYDASTLPKPRIGGGIEPLREEHGWIEHTGSTTWFRGPDHSLVQIAENGRGIGTVRPQKYSEFSGKYVFWHSSANQTWLIGPAGALERALQPPPPLRGRIEPAAGDTTLVRFVRVNPKAEWDVGDAGLYGYSKNRAPRRLARGIVRGMHVHKGGCLVAMIVDPWNGRNREHLVITLDLCR